MISQRLCSYETELLNNIELRTDAVLLPLMKTNCHSGWVSDLFQVWIDSQVWEVKQMRQDLSQEETLHWDIIKPITRYVQNVLKYNI